MVDRTICRDEEDALAQLRRRCHDNPDDRSAALELAQHYCDRGWFNEAIEVYDKELRLAPDNTALLLEYGNTVFRKKDYLAAIRFFTRLTELAPERIEGWNNLGIALIHQGDNEAARAAFERVLAIEPQNCGAMLNMGNYFSEREDYAEAHRWFERACTSCADYSDGWYNLGNACIALGRLDEARTAFEKALRYSPEFFSALKNLGWVHERQGRLEEAHRCYVEALRGSRADAHLHVNLGNVQVQLRMYEEAKKSFLKAIRLSPNDPGGWMGLRGYALAKGDVSTFVRATLAILPRISDEHLAQSIEVLSDLNQTEKADELLAQADRLGRTGDLLDCRRMLLYQRKGIEAEKKEEIFKRLSECAEPSDSIRSGLARYLLMSGEPQAAISQIERMVDPDVKTLGTLWRAMIALERRAEARHAILQYIKEHRDSCDAYFLLADIEASSGHLGRAGYLLVHALDNGFNGMEEIRSSAALTEIFESIAGKRLIEEA